MLTEFTGPPGSGKSFIANKNHSKYLLRRKITIYDEIRLLFIACCKLDFSVILFLLNASFKESVPLIFKMNILRNALRKFGIYFIHRDAIELVICDEGVSHLPYNFLNTEPRIIIDKIAPYLSEITVISVVTLHDRVILGRLKQRGHKRLNYMTSETFLQKNKNVESEILASYPKICKKFVEENNG